MSTDQASLDGGRTGERPSITASADRPQRLAGRAMDETVRYARRFIMILVVVGVQPLFIGRI
jgi:hypothetical protein